MDILKFLEGKKTYILAICTIVYASLGVFLGQIDQQTAINMILAALGGMTMRSGVAKK